MYKSYGFHQNLQTYSISNTVETIGVNTCHNYNMELTYVTTIYGIANTMSVKDQVQWNLSYTNIMYSSIHVNP